LTQPLVQGLPLHTRSLTVWVRPMAGGRWLARGDVIDLRKNGFVPSSYDVQPSGIIHSMNIELELDPDTLRIERVRVDQPYVAVEPSIASEGECCRDPAPRLTDLAGECLDGAFAKTLSGNFGGPLGCSHLLTLFQLMASAVPRAAEIEHARFAREGTRPAEDERFFRRSVFVDGFEIDETRNDVSVQLADTAIRPYDPDTSSFQRLELSHEVKTFVTIERKGLLIDRLDVRERMRTAETILDSEWVDHGERVAAIVGHRIVPGLAGRIFGALGSDPALNTVRDNLLMLAPGFIQVIAAQMERHFEDQIRAARAQRDRPPNAALGGQQGACYMWRAGGALERARDRFGRID
jgi:hypothetical protein